MQPMRIELLQQMPIFGAISDDALQFLLAQAREVSVRAGEHFFRENDQANSMFVIETGNVSVTRRWQGREFVLHGMGPGDCFGEMALMDMSSRSASVRAETDCVAIELTTGDLLSLYEHDLKQFTLIQMNIGREVCRRLRATDDLLFRARMGETPVVPQLFRPG